MKQSVANIGANPLLQIIYLTWPRIYHLLVVIVARISNIIDLCWTYAGLLITINHHEPTMKSASRHGAAHVQRDSSYPRNPISMPPPNALSDEFKSAVVT